MTQRNLVHKRRGGFLNPEKLETSEGCLGGGLPSAASPEILPFEPSDFETLLAIDQKCFPPGIAYSRSELTRFLRHRQAKSWVAHLQSEIVGFLIFGREPQKMGHIVTIDVIESKRGGGVGTALMETAEEWAGCQGLRLIYLETAEDNRAAQIFYSARGYAKVEEIAHYYPNGQTAWVMVKWLSGR
jgi:[ribosomal protein S18]-alanine N-acetyltransferase